MLPILIYYLIAVNLITFCVMGYDKRMAKHKKRRIPERHLFLYAFVGGAIGSFLGMKFFRHKTKHASFQYGIPALIVLHLLALAYAFGLIL
jgi:uncharacterized membrane protein YsdA (DUF1294 family)